jgi:hypothetical protein
MSWLEAAEKDQREMRWRRKTVDREERASVIKGAKAVRGL